MANLSFHVSALCEYQQAILWYQERSIVAARRFVAEVDAVLESIITQPDRFAFYEAPFREASLRRFPFHVIYRMERCGSVLVVAVAHASREPGYWMTSS